MAIENNPLGLYIQDLMAEQNLSQRELASSIGISHTVLNDILKGKRSINPKIAILLQAAGIGSAEKLMEIQIKSLLEKEENNDEVILKKEAISNWNELKKILPLTFLKKYIDTTNNILSDEKKIYNLFKVDNIDELKLKFKNYEFTYFRKSTALKEDRSNVISWSLLAEYEASQIDVPKFNKSKESELLNELKLVLNENINTIDRVRSTLYSYGIKFLILDRPPKTPVDGKSFMSDNNPAIVLTLKYKRLDNFAFTLFHELAHVFKHLTGEYKDVSFFVSNTGDPKEEEADIYAQDSLIERNEWKNFLDSNFYFSDDVIYDFSKQINIHPAIVRGRVCYVYNNYYRKRSSISQLNKVN